MEPQSTERNPERHSGTPRDTVGLQGTQWDSRVQSGTTGSKVRFQGSKEDCRDTVGPQGTQWDLRGAVGPREP